MLAITRAVMIPFDDNVIGYRQIMDLFHSPTDAGGQFCDRGNQYRTAIFCNDAGAG
jgi:peptide-methionine (S)-S-oxide reductase